MNIEKLMKKLQTPTKSIYERNFEKLEKLGLIKEIKEGSTTLKSGSFMDLHFEIHNIEKDLVYGSMAHYYEQNGDLCPNPDISFRIDRTAGTIEVLDYSDYFGYQNVYTEDGKGVYLKRKNSLNRFLGQWLSNLKKQGFKNK